MAEYQSFRAKDMFDFSLGPIDGSLIASTDNLLRFEGETEGVPGRTDYLGEFSYDEFDNLTGGTLNSVLLMKSGLPIGSITGLNLPVTDLMPPIDVQDAAALLIFSGADSIDGSNFDDRLRGFAGNDIIVGNDGDDELFGDEGNDVLHGGAGNNRIDGGGGADTAVFSVPFTSATLTKVSPTEFTVHSSEGVDQVINVEFFQFSDQTVAAETFVDPPVTLIGSDTSDSLSGLEGDDLIVGMGGNDSLSGDFGNDMLFGDSALARYYGFDVANQVYRLYEATLGRAPDVGGHETWAYRVLTGQITLADAAGGFVGSQEFQNVYGALDDPGFVGLLYLNVLGRPAQNGEEQGWLDRLAGGTSRAEIVLGFSESPEFIQTTTQAANAYAFTSDPATWTDDVYRLYQATLGRDPDATGLTGWAQQLGNGVRSLAEVSAGFVGSQEFQNIYGALDNAGFVGLLYQNVLGRPAQGGEEQGWLDQLAGGTSRADVVLGFSQSPEFVNATAAGVKAWVRDLGTNDELTAGPGTNTVAGGMFADVFVFSSGETGSTTVLDFEPWDYLQLSGFGYADLATAKAQMREEGADVIFADQGVEVVLQNTALNDIQLDSFQDTFMIA